MSDEKITPVKNRPAKIRGIHRYSFRNGEWGELMGVRQVTPKDTRGDDMEERPCYVVMYPDGYLDYIPIAEDLTYEIG